MLWFKAWHIIAMVAWFAGLFYLPRLFVYHTSTEDEISLKRFEIMERRLYYGIMWPAAIFTTILGIAMVFQAKQYYFSQHWFHWKMTMVLALWVYHGLCGHYLRLFVAKRNKHSSRFFRVFNEMPTLVLIGVVLLVVLKPSL